MKKLSAFQKFDAGRFFDGKTLTATDIKDWADFDSKKILGKKVSVVISDDQTVYPDGEVGYNLFEAFDIKVAKNTVDVKRGERVEIINPQVTVWGDFRNKISVKADDVIVAASSQKKV